MSNAYINRRKAPAQLDHESREHANTSRLQPLMWLLVVGLLPVTSKAQNFSFSTFDVPGAGSTELHGINRHMIGLRSQSTIIGTYQDISGKHAFSLGPGGFTTLPDPPNSVPAGLYRDTEARGINNAGVIVGSYVTADFTTRPFRYFSGLITDPGECVNAGYVATEAYGINDQGAVVGACQSDGLWNGGPDFGFGSGFYFSPSLNVITSPGFFGPSARYPVISGINDSGLMVGWFTDNGNAENVPAHGFYMSAQAGLPHTVVDLPNLIGISPGVSGTWLRGVNNQNQIVGYYYEGGRYHGFFWPHVGASPITVDYPGAVDTHILGISDPHPLTGQIEVVGYYSNRTVVNNIPVHHGFVAIPTPVAHQ